MIKSIESKQSFSFCDICSGDITTKDLESIIAYIGKGLGWYSEPDKFATHNLLPSTVSETNPDFSLFFALLFQIYFQRKHTLTHKRIIFQ